MVLKEKLQTSASFRAIAKGFFIINLYLDMSERSPTHTTLLNWVHKIGYYELIKPKAKADDWIIIIDESIQIGQDKILVILGIRESEIDFSRPLRFNDLVPLREISKKSWTGELISECINEVKEELGDIKYAVGDYGSAIKKGLELSGTKHVHDITHKIALILKGLYEKDEEYKTVTVNMSKMRPNLLQSNIAHIIPPSQRQKSRYHNIEIVSDWGMKALNYLDKDTNIDKKAKDNLIWLKEHKQFFEELSEINKIICEVEKEIKLKGFSLKTIKTCNDLLKKLKSTKGKILKDELDNYFKEILKLLPEIPTILCTSDIIESAFGKYKNYISHNPMAGITNLVLCIAAFTSNLDENEIQIALENTTMNDIKRWTEENIGITLLQKRREAFGYI